MGYQDAEASARVSEASTSRKVVISMDEMTRLSELVLETGELVWCGFKGPYPAQTTALVLYIHVVRIVLGSELVVPPPHAVPTTAPESSP